MSNHVIIGLGGTGGSEIKEFRKFINEQFGSNTPPLPIRVRYLYIDSSRNDLKASSTWLTQQDVGEDISLDPASQFSISENNLATRLRDPVNYKVTHRYIGEPRHWTDLFATMNVNEAAGGQIRRLGESLAEPRMAEFVSHMEHTIVRGLRQESGRDKVAFHVCAGLAGGTGSGTFIQIVAQLRRSFPDSQSYPIYLYLLLPEEQSNRAANGESTNYYANGFAALQELNAYLLADTRPDNVGGPLYSPIDLTGKTERLKGLKDRLQGVFLASNVNEEGHYLSVDKDMPKLFAQLLYQRIFLLDRADPAHYRSLLNAISLENLQVPDEHKESDQQVKLRSIRFQTFGTKRIMVPEEEIRDHFTATIASQSLRQMRFNHWYGIEDGAAKSEYKAEPRNISFADYVAKESNRAAFYIDNARIILSTGILKNEISAGWKTHEQTWDDIDAEFTADAWGHPKDKGRDVRLERLATLYQQYHDKGYRLSGVEDFFETKTTDLGKPDRHIAELRARIENWMMQQWTEGAYSANDLEVFMQDLLADFDKRLKTISTRITELAGKEPELLKKRDANVQAWQSVGLGGKWLGFTGVFTTLEDVFSAQNLVLKEIYKNRTLKRAWEFATILIKRLRAELNDKLVPELIDFRSGLDNVIDFFDKREKANCPDPTQTNAAPTIDLNNDTNLKFYEPDAVRTYSSSLLEEKSRQETWAGQARRAILEVAEQHRSEVNGRERPFASVATYAFRNEAAKAKQERISRQQAEAAHDGERPTTGRFIGVNIVSKLQEKYPTRERLLPYLTDIVAGAQTFNRFRQVEITNQPQSVLTVILPTCEHQATYRELLAQTFRDCQRPGVTVVIVDSNTRLNEITLISFKYAFPLRYLEQVWYLKDKFEHRLTQSARAVIEVYSEDHRPELPSIFRASPGESGERMLPHLQIVQAFGLFKEGVSLRTNKPERYLELNDAHGLPVAHYYPIELISLLEPPQYGNPVMESEHILQALRMVQESAAELLADEVAKLLKQDKYRQATEREKVKEVLRQQLSNVRVSRAGDLRDPIYLKFHQSSQLALSLIDQPI